MINWKLKAGLVVLIIIVLIMGYFLIRGRTYTNVVAPKPDSTLVIKQGDVTVREKEFVIAQDKAAIAQLQDSLDRITTKLTGVKPIYLVRYKDTIRFKDSIMYQLDTTKDNQLDSLTRVLSYLQGRVMLVPKLFLDSGRFFKVQGTVNLRSVDISNVEIYNNTSVSIGTKGRWYQPKTLIVNVTEDNPFLSSGQVQAYYFKPKPIKWGVVVGPTLTASSKGLTYGIGLTAGYKIL